MVQCDAMPGMPPPGPADESLPLLRWLWEEAKFHLLPPGLWRTKGMLQAAEIGFAVAVTVAWVLAETGRIGSAAVIAWWTGWSVYEVVCRRAYLPWIKEGPWWQRNFRKASLADIMAYVATKNLLIGTVLFALLKTAGMLGFLSELSTLQWLQ